MSTGDDDDGSGAGPGSDPVLCSIRRWQTAPFMEVEVAIRLLYMLGEALPASHGAHFSGDSAKTSALQDMMRTVSHMTRHLEWIRTRTYTGQASGGVVQNQNRLPSLTAPRLSSAGFLRRQRLPALLRISGVF